MRPEVTSIVALAVSVCSFGVSFWNVFRDRVRLKITAEKGLDRRIHGMPIGMPIPSLVITVANTGRKPIKLRRPVKVVAVGPVYFALSRDDHYEDWPAGGRLIDADHFVAYLALEEWHERRRAGASECVAVEVLDYRGQRHAKSLSGPAAAWLNSLPENEC